MQYLFGVAQFTPELPPNTGLSIGSIRNETSTHQAKDAVRLRSVLTYRGNLLSWSDVPSRYPGRIFIESKVNPEDSVPSQKGGIGRT
jgi:hypothetical protein